MDGIENGIQIVDEKHIEIDFKKLLDSTLHKGFPKHNEPEINDKLKIKYPITDFYNHMIKYQNTGSQSKYKFIYESIIENIVYKYFYFNEGWYNIFMDYNLLKNCYGEQLIKTIKKNNAIKRPATRKIIYRVPVYLPNFVIKLLIDVADPNHTFKLGIYAIDEFNYLYRWILPNTYPDGSVCQNDKISIIDHFNENESDLKNFIEICEMYIDIYFDSVFNTDLISYTDVFFSEMNISRNEYYEACYNNDHNIIKRIHKFYNNLPSKLFTHGKDDAQLSNGNLHKKTILHKTIYDMIGFQNISSTKYIYLYDDVQLRLSDKFNFRGNDYILLFFENHIEYDDFKLGYLTPQHFILVLNENENKIEKLSLQDIKNNFEYFKLELETYKIKKSTKSIDRYLMIMMDDGEIDRIYKIINNFTLIIINNTFYMVSNSDKYIYTISLNRFNSESYVRVSNDMIDHTGVNNETIIHKNIHLFEIETSE
jgi:hypothetical protein